MSKSVQPSGSIGIESGSEGVSHDQGFDLLSNHRRRYVLYYLHERDQRAELGELAEIVAAWENEVSLSEVSSADRKRVYTSLQQVHLPRMDDLGVVEFDDREGTVRLGPASDDLNVYMEVVTGADVPWSQFYLGLSVLNVALLAAAGADLVPLTAFPDIAWGAFATTTVLVASVVHTYYNRTEMRLGSTERPAELDG